MANIATIRPFALCFVISLKVEWSAETADSLRSRSCWELLQGGERSELEEFIEHALPGELIQFRSAGVVVFRVKE